jgi:hypothetical protein
MKAYYATPFHTKKLELNAPTSGGRSVDIIRSRTQATEFFFFFAMKTCGDPRFLYLGTAALLPGKDPTVPTEQEAGWTLEPVSTTEESENSLPSRDSNSEL